MSWPGAAWRHRSYSSCSVRTLCSESTNSRPSRRLTSTTPNGSEWSSESKDPLLCLHDALALLLFEQLADGAIFTRRDGKPHRPRSAARQEDEHDRRRLQEGHALDVAVGQEPGVAPHAVAVEAEVDPRHERNHEDEVQRHHRLREDV